MSEKIQRKGGRPHKINKHNYNIKVRFNAEDYNLLQNKLEELNQKNTSKYIRSVLFGREIRVVTTDESLYKIIEVLSKITAQYRRVGVNYNQVTKHINTCFGEQKAKEMLEELEQTTKMLVKISEGIASFNEKLKKKYDC
ncbi:MAG: plasmid mobilization protein [Bacteroidales bacterium]